MKNKLLFLSIFFLFSATAVAQPSLRNSDMIRIADKKEGQEMKSPLVKIEGTKFIAKKGFKFMEIQQGFILVPTSYNSRKPDVKELMKGIDGFKMLTTGVKFYCTGSCACNPKSCGDGCLQCSGCCDIHSKVDGGGIWIPEYATP